MFISIGSRGSKSAWNNRSVFSDVDHLRVHSPFAPSIITWVSSLLGQVEIQASERRDVCGHQHPFPPNSCVNLSAAVRTISMNQPSAASLCRPKCQSVSHNIPICSLGIGCSETSLRGSSDSRACASILSSVPPQVSDPLAMLRISVSQSFVLHVI